jgi:hypothetical protein
MKSDSSDIAFVASGVFAPTWIGYVYGNKDRLVFPSVGVEYTPRSLKTYLFGFSLDGASSAPNATGHVDLPIFQYAVDVKDNILRLAVFIVWNNMTAVLNRQECTAINGTIVGDIGDGAIFRDDYLCESNGEPPIATIVPADGEPIAIEGEVCCDTVSDYYVSGLPREAENYVITLEMTPVGGNMKELGRIKLGKTVESFTSARFFGNVAVTGRFEKRDPIYVLDMSDASNPKKVSELDFWGFPDYLQSINDNNTLFLSIGQDDNNGTYLGIQISIFDMQDLTKPKVAQSLTIDRNAYWDLENLHYENGRLIIPMEMFC